MGQNFTLEKHMKSNQDDSIPGGIIRAEVAPEKPAAKLQSDERKAFANYLPLNKFFDNRSEQALGRVAVVPEKPQRWQLSPESRKNILAAKRWSAGIELLERMMDWNEVLDLLKKADHYFNLGLALENGWIYLPIDGEKTEIRRSDFKVLRPIKSIEKKELKLKEREETKI